MNDDKTLHHFLDLARRGGFYADTASTNELRAWRLALAARDLAGLDGRAFDGFLAFAAIAHVQPTTAADLVDVGQPPPAADLVDVGQPPPAAAVEQLADPQMVQALSKAAYELESAADFIGERPTDLRALKMVDRFRTAAAYMRHILVEIDERF